jgi:hypothetical protein
MTVFARTGELRRSAGEYGRVASSCLDVAQDTSSCTKDLAGEITDPAVSTAISAALVAVLRELQLVGGAFAYSESELTGSAESYDRADEASAGHLRGMVPRAD